MGKTERGGRPSTAISKLFFILCRAPVSPRPLLAESSFEVIMELLVNALLQVPLGRPVSRSSSTAT